MTSLVIGVVFFWLHGAGSLISQDSVETNSATVSAVSADLQVLQLLRDRDLDGALEILGSRSGSGSVPTP